MLTGRRSLSRLKCIPIILLVGALTLVSGTTTFGQQPPDEYALGDIPLDPVTYQKFLRIPPSEMAEDALPSAYDARDEGIVTSPKDQGSCGSCWAFASAGAIEAHMLRTFGVGPEDVSEQQQVSCNTTQSGCAGGSSDSPRYWETHGPLYEACLPYTASDDTACGEAQCEQMRFRVVDWHTVLRTTSGFKTSLHSDGPSYWRYDVYSDFSSYWTTGSTDDVYVNAAGTTRQGGHAVLLIGWDDAKSAFLCKNSWGENAGPNGDGTFWIAYSGHAHDLGFGMSNFSLAGYQATCTWTGATSTDWGTDSNWACEEGILPDGLAVSNHVPGPGDDVVIPTSPSGGRWPTLSSGDFGAHDVTIEAGAQLNMTGGALDVTGDWAEASAGVASAAGGSISFAAYVGSPDQAVAVGASSSFYDVQVGLGTGAQTVTLNSDIDVNGDLTILKGASLAAGSHTISLSGDWSDGGNSFIPGTSTLILDGDGQSLRKMASAHLLGPEGFEGAFPPASWTAHTLAGNPWLQGPPGSNGGGDPHSGAEFAWHNDDENPQNTWLVSPRIDIPAAGATMSFWERNYWMGYYEPDGAHYVMASTGSCNPGDGAFALLAEYDTGAASWRQRDLSLDSYAGQAVCLAFNYRGDYSAEWYIDDVEVTTPISDGELAFHNLRISGAGAPAFGGRVIVGNDLTVAADGTLDLSGLDITVAGTLANNGSLRQTIGVGAGETGAFAHVGDGNGGYSYLGALLTDTSGAGLGSTTVTIKGNQTCPVSQGIEDPIRRCFEVTPATPNEATLRLFYLTSELNGNNPATVLIFHEVDGVWSTEEGTYSREGDGGEYDWVQVTGVDAYSPFTARDQNPTAVEIIEFVAIPSCDGVMLGWKTATEVGLVGFDLYRGASADGPFERLNAALIAAQQPGSPVGAMYAWHDGDAPAGTSWYYRLEQVQVGDVRTTYGPLLATVPHCVFLPQVAR